MAKKPNSRNTKAEILEAYKELAKEKSDLEAQLKQGNGSASKTATPPAPSERNGAPPKSTKKQSEAQKIQDTIARLTQLQAGFGSAVSDLSEKLTVRASKLEELRELSDRETEQLAQLYDITEIDDDTLDNLIEQYETDAKTFSEEFDRQRETLEQALSERQQAWRKEQAEHEQAIKERNDRDRKARERDEETYRYELENQRQREQEQYKQSQQELYRQLQEDREATEQQWEERERAIAEREQQFEDYKAKVEAFPQELEATVKRGKETGRNIGQYQAKVKADLYAKEVEGQKQSYELQLQSLEETIGDREARIQTLSKQLDAALKQVQDLAVKAIEGSANQNSLQAIKDIAIEQAKNQQRNK